MKDDKKTLILSVVLIGIAFLAFLGTLRLEPTPPPNTLTPPPTAISSTPTPTPNDKFDYNNNAAAMMQVYAGITSTIAGFAIAVIILMVSRTQGAVQTRMADQEPLEPQSTAGAIQSNDMSKNMKALMDSTISSFIATFLTSLIAALLFASGSAQLPNNSDRAYAVMVSPLFVLALSLSFLSLGVIMFVTYYKLEEALNTARKIYYASLLCLVIGFSIATYEACFRLFTYNGVPRKSFFLFVAMAISSGASCFVIRQAYYKRKNKKFYERKFSRYVTACIISCLVSYLLMTMSFEEMLKDSWLMPPWISKSFLVVFSLLMGWSLTYIPTRKESLECWGDEVPEEAKNINEVLKVVSTHIQKNWKDNLSYIRKGCEILFRKRNISGRKIDKDVEENDRG
jgi:drug/metabolite transporter (DMT)-like permease